MLASWRQVVTDVLGMGQSLSKVGELSVPEPIALGQEIVGTETDLVLSVQYTLRCQRCETPCKVWVPLSMSPESTGVECFGRRHRAVIVGIISEDGE